MSRAIQLVVGLGNPGREYADTRHNAGAWLVEEMARRHGVTLRDEPKLGGELGKAMIEGRAVWLFEPGSYMNVSGQPVRKVVDFYKIPVDEVLVVHDDLELLPGEAKLKSGGGHGGHNGVRDLARHLGPGFERLRLGIGRPGQKGRSGKIPVENFVLKAPSGDDRTEIDIAVARGADAVEALVAGDRARAERMIG
jgi:PTH1 family peptidyl-tRNA hydrolase